MSKCSFKILIFIIAMLFSLNLQANDNIYILPDLSKPQGEAESKAKSKISQYTPPKEEDKSYLYPNTGKYKLVERFTAHTLQQNEIKLGLESEYGLNSSFLIGTDSLNIILESLHSMVKWNLKNIQQEYKYRPSKLLV